MASLTPSCLISSRIGIRYAHPLWDHEVGGDDGYER
jgi:hypothetical protein